MNTDTPKPAFECSKCDYASDEAGDTHTHPTPERVTLSATYPHQCCAGSCVEEIGLHDVDADTAKRAVEFVAAREAALRAQVKAEIREFADSRGINVGGDDSDWWKGYRQAQRECLYDASDLAARIAGGDQ